MANPVVVKKYQLWTRHTHHNQCPTGWALYGSNDDKTWVQLDSRADESPSSWTVSGLPATQHTNSASVSQSSTTKSFTVTSSASYTYVKLTITNAGDNGYHHVSIAEFAIYGAEGPDADAEASWL